MINVRKINSILIYFIINGFFLLIFKRRLMVQILMLIHGITEKLMFLTLLTILSLFQAGLQCSQGRWTTNIHNSHAGLLSFFNASSGPSYYYKTYGRQISVYLAQDCDSPQIFLKIEFTKPTRQMHIFNQSYNVHPIFTVEAKSPTPQMYQLQSLLNKQLFKVEFYIADEINIKSAQSTLLSIKFDHIKIKEIQQYYNLLFYISLITFLHIVASHIGVGMFKDSQRKDLTYKTLGFAPINTQLIAFYTNCIILKTRYDYSGLSSTDVFAWYSLGVTFVISLLFLLGHPRESIRFILTIASLFLVQLQIIGIHYIPYIILLLKSCEIADLVSREDRFKKYECIWLLLIELVATHVCLFVVLHQCQSRYWLILSFIIEAAILKIIQTGGLPTTIKYLTYLLSKNESSNCNCRDNEKEKEIQVSVKDKHI